MSRRSNPDVEFPDSLALGFERSARTAGERPALLGDGFALTYTELRRRQRAAQTALAALGSPRSVALVHDRTPDAVAAVLAVLDSGATLVPIDGAQPDARVETVLDDARPELILTEGPGRLAGRGARPLASLFDGEPAEAAALPKEDRPALVLYTSGSTGVPKAVAWSAGDFARAVLASTSNVPPADDEVWICKANGGLVDQMDELFGALLRGRPTVLASRDDVAQPRRLVALMTRHAVTRFIVVPSYLRILLQTVPDLATALPRLRTWIATGEPIDGALVRAFHERVPQGDLFNDYGTTEAWGLAIARLDAGPAEEVSITLGAAYPGVTLAVLDDDGRPARDGSTGWLAVGSPWLSEAARGTLENGLSRTGDLARRRADGAIELAGRGDAQIKIHGLRIDPVEIEGQLATHPDLLEAAVTSWRGADGREHLIAYVVPREGSTVPDERALERHLRSRLPPAWIPARYRPIAALPRNAGGKLDRRRLPEPVEAGGPEPAEPPPTPLEREVAALLAAALDGALGGAPVGPDDDLRHRGLDSLGVIAAVTALHDRFGVEIAGRELMETRTAREIAAIVESRRGAMPVAEREVEEPDPAGEPVTGPMATAMAVDWQAGGLDPAWNIVDGFDLRGPLDPALLATAIRELTGRHELLRARFFHRDGRYLHLVAANPEAELRIHPPATDGPELERRIEVIATERASARFRWEEIPRVRFDLVPRGSGLATLLVTVDHLVSDEQSLWILGRDLFELYRTAATRETPRLPPVRPLRAFAREAADAELQRAGEARLRAICAAARGTPLVSAARSAALGAPGTLRAKTVELSAAELAALTRRATELGTTTHALLLCAAVAVRWLEERLPLVPVSTVLGGRDDLRKDESIGLFNRLALLSVAGVDAGTSLRSLVDAVDRELRLGWRYQEVDTFGVVLHEGCVPLIRACRVNYFHRDPELAPSDGAPLVVERRELFEPLTVDEWSLQAAASDRLVLRLEGRADLLSEERATWGLATCLAVLDRLSVDVDSTLSDLGEQCGEAPARARG